MLRTIVGRTSQCVHKSFVRFPALDRAIVSCSLLTLGLFAILPNHAEAQTVSQAFGNLFSSARLYVDPSSPAKRQADAWRRSRPADAALMDKIAEQPLAQGVGGWNADVADERLRWRSDRERTRLATSTVTTPSRRWTVSRICGLSRAFRWLSPRLRSGGSR